MKPSLNRQKSISDIEPRGIDIDQCMPLWAAADGGCPQCCAVRGAALPHRLIYPTQYFSAVRTVADTMTLRANSTPRQLSRLEGPGNVTTSTAIRRASSASRSGTRLNVPDVHGAPAFIAQRFGTPLLFFVAAAETFHDLNGVLGRGHQSSRFSSPCSVAMLIAMRHASSSVRTSARNASDLLALQ